MGIAGLADSTSDDALVQVGGDSRDYQQAAVGCGANQCLAGVGDGVTCHTQTLWVLPGEMSKNDEQGEGSMKPQHVLRLAAPNAEHGGVRFH